MDKLKIAEWGEKLKTGGAQMSRMVSGKVKEMLQAPTLESKMVDEATLETLEEPNWGMNMRICAQINNEEFNGTEIVRAIKRKISGKSPVSQRLSLELLEACAMNCEKIFSEVASEKVLDEMVWLIKNGEADSENRRRAFQLIRAWGQSQDLAYLPVFQQTYMSLQGENGLNARGEENPMSGQSSLESLLQRPVPVPPPGSYPVPNQEQARGDDDGLDYNFGNLSIKEKKEQIEITRNSLELLSSMLNTEGKPDHTEDDLTVSLMEKCKQSQPLIQMIIESTTDDEGVLFEALHVNDELQRVLSIYKKPGETVKNASIVEHQESSGSKDAGPKPEEEEEPVKKKEVDDDTKHSESSGSSNKIVKEDKQAKIELGLSSDEDEK
ncbi:hypothetical protein EUTSA_v10007923mg [Eutrema salsugineum]|uniref:VHS domain-containing protein n=1 Tax=Eutrema salsugineum TaxID=72664 RepID=V4L949_EUTSA|nr:TOM1-like protein 2 [Eutrema salsugineum]ESQ36298.1 hypothetical protein EUTSA_v10007923mg [Eutrema salsugineum]